MAEGIPFRALGTSFELVWEIDAVRQGRERTSFRITDREQAVRWVGFVLDEPHGMLLLRAALAARPAFEPDRLSDVEVIEEVLKALEFRRLRVFRGVDFRGGGRMPTRPPIPHPGPRSPSQPPLELSYYEIAVVDELDQPLVGLPMSLVTPSGARERRTDGSGRVRLENEPEGMGSARVTSLQDLSRIMRGYAHKPRRVTPHPEGPTWHVRTPRQLDRAIALPDAELHTLMIVTRVDICHFAVEHHCARYRFECRPEGPWVLRQDPHPRLSIHSEGLGKRVQVVAVPAEERTVRDEIRLVRSAPPEGPAIWLDLSVDELADALLRRDHQAVSAMLAGIPLDQPFFPPVQC